MIEESTGKLFAQCQIPNGEHDKYVERAIDSSRYFVLKITNGARHAFIGLGFEDRNDAFDFNVCLADFKTTFVDRDADALNAGSKTAGPPKDLSLKEGQKISLNIGGFGDKKRRQPEGGAPAGGGFLGIAPPPPPAGQSRRQAPSGGYGAEQPAPVPFPAPAASPAAAPAGDRGTVPAAAFPAGPVAFDGWGAPPSSGADDPFAAAFGVPAPAPFGTASGNRDAFDIFS